MKEIYEFLKKTKTYFLATVDNNQPRVRPFGTINMFENKLYIQTGKIKKVSKEIEKNNKVEICAFNGKEWLRLYGELIEDDRYIAKKSLLDNYPELSSMYKADDNNTQVFYFKNAIGIIYSFDSKPKEYKF